MHTVHVVATEPPARLSPQQHHHDHEHLQNLVTQLRHSLGRCDRDDVYAKAQHLQRDLMKHIREEDGPGGLYEEISEGAPQLSHAMKRLRAQHAELIRDLKMIAAEVDDCAMLSPLVEEFGKMLAQHETDEESLIAEAFYRDEGTEE